MQKPYDILWINARVVTCDARNQEFENAAIAVKDGKVAWIGELQNLPCPHDDAANEIVDLERAVVTPGFIDCHTHLVYAGNRANEFSLRLQGVTYSEIAKNGGGIQATVKATREASVKTLFEQSLPRAKSLVASGVTTLEIKSGYGLDFKTECKMLEVACMIEKDLGVEVHRTFLGAHTVPKEFKERADDYVKMVCEEMIPKIAKEKLATAVDVFCENIAFTLEQTEKVFRTARDHHLQIKCHAEQLSASGAAALAAQYHATSVDHLEFLTDKDVATLAEAKVTAVLLPGAYYFLREKQLPPVSALQKANVPIAIASDCNPGTSPIASLLLIMNMACVLFGLTSKEALQAVTINAAKALKIAETHGSLEKDKVADFAVFDVQSADELAYFVGTSPLKFSVKKGKKLFSSSLY